MGLPLARWKVGVGCNASQAAGMDSDGLNGLLFDMERYSVDTVSSVLHPYTVWAPVPNFSIGCVLCPTLEFPQEFPQYLLCNRNSWERKFIISKRGCKPGKSSDENATEKDDKEEWLLEI